MEILLGKLSPGGEEPSPDKLLEQQDQKLNIHFNEKPDKNQEKFY
jgi:hypothetical protein